MDGRLVALVVVLASAGCLSGPTQEAQGCPALEYVSLHYDVRLDDARVHAVLRDLGWTAAGGEGTVARFRAPDPGIEAVVAAPAGASGAGTVLTVRETRDVPGEGPVPQARAVAEAVNATLGDPPLDAWIQGAHETCPAERR